VSPVGRRTAAQLAGGAAEEVAERFLVRRGLQVIARNYRTRMGEIDLVARDGATLVFIEVRMRAASAALFGGAAASIDGRKRRRIEAAARHFLARLGREPACRFDVVTLDGASAIEWHRAAFETA
jgi:putative endonuclease